MPHTPPQCSSKNDSDSALPPQRAAARHSPPPHTDSSWSDRVRRSVPSRGASILDVSLEPSFASRNSHDTATTKSPPLSPPPGSKPPASYHSLDTYAPSYPESPTSTQRDVSGPLIDARNLTPGSSLLAAEVNGGEVHALESPHAEYKVHESENSLSLETNEKVIVEPYKQGSTCATCGALRSSNAELKDRSSRPLALPSLIQTQPQQATVLGAGPTADSTGTGGVSATAAGSVAGDCCLTCGNALGRQSVATRNRICLLKCLQQFSTEQRSRLGRQSAAGHDLLHHSEVQSASSDRTESPGLEAARESGTTNPSPEGVLRAKGLGGYWSEILPSAVSGFLDLRSTVRLRQVCKRLYNEKRYSIAITSFDDCSTLTEQELINKVLPSLSTFLSAGSLRQLNFSRCCLLTDSFVKQLLTLQNGKFRLRLRALYFDFCYALTDKALETLLLTPLPQLEILSLRCARSRDLTGAPFSQPGMLTKERWPRLHQFSCTCTQMALQPLDSIALFIAERAVELGVSPKLGIAGSLASNSLMRRLGLSDLHQAFIEALILDGSVGAIDAAIGAFEAKWLKAVDEPDDAKSYARGVLHQLLRSRGVPVLINAPCSMAVVDEGGGKEKAVLGGSVTETQEHSTASSPPPSGKNIRPDQAGVVTRHEAATLASGAGPRTCACWLRCGALNGSSPCPGTERRHEMVATGPECISHLSQRQSSDTLTGTTSSEGMPCGALSDAGQPVSSDGLRAQANNRGCPVLTRVHGARGGGEYEGGHEATSTNRALGGLVTRGGDKSKTSDVPSVKAGDNPVASLATPGPLEKTPNVTHAPHPSPNVTREVETSSRGEKALGASTIASGTPSLGDNASTTAPFEDHRQRAANYSRWTYPLHIAIRLGNLPAVATLLQRGAHVDIWGYSFTTPLYVACANAHRNAVKIAAGSESIEATTQLSRQGSSGIQGSRNRENAGPADEDQPLWRHSSLEMREGANVPDQTMQGSRLASNVSRSSYITTRPLSVFVGSHLGSLSFESTSESEKSFRSGRPDLADMATTSPIPHQGDAAKGAPSVGALAGSDGCSASDTRPLAPGPISDGPSIPKEPPKPSVAGAVSNTNVTADLTSRLNSSTAGCPCACHQRRGSMRGVMEAKGGGSSDSRRQSIKSHHPLGCPAALEEPEPFLARRKIVDLLLRWKAPVDAPDLYLIKSPMNAAIKNDDHVLLKTLIRCGARINMRRLNPSCVGHVIQQSRRQQEKRHRSSQKGGFARLSCKSSLFIACEVGAVRCIEVLLDAKADPHWTDPFSDRNVTPTLVAYRKNPSLLPLFLDKGAGSAKSTRWVLSEVLAAAILQEDMVSIKLLVTRYPDLLEKDCSGMWSLPLLQAARLNKISVVKFLVSVGADCNVANGRGITALHLAAAEGHRDIIDILVSEGAALNVKGGPSERAPLHMAVEEDQLEVVETLLSRGAQSGMRDADGVTPLMTAITSRSDRVAMTLIAHGSVEDLNVTDSTGRTALMYSIYFGQFKVADTLLSRGASVLVKDDYGSTAESLLKDKIQSLEQSSSSGSTINKLIRGIVGGGAPQGNQPPSAVSGGGAAALSRAGSGRVSDSERPPVSTGSGGMGSRAAAAAAAIAAVVTGTSVSSNAGGGSGASAGDASRGELSDENMRRLNVKRRKVARSLLKKIRAAAAAAVERGAKRPSLTQTKGSAALPSKPCASESSTLQQACPRTNTSELDSTSTARITGAATLRNAALLSSSIPSTKTRESPPREEGLAASDFFRTQTSGPGGGHPTLAAAAHKSISRGCETILGSANEYAATGESDMERRYCETRDSSKEPLGILPPKVQPPMRFHPPGRAGIEIPHPIPSRFASDNSLDCFWAVSSGDDHGLGTPSDTTSSSSDEEPGRG